MSGPDHNHVGYAVCDIRPKHQAEGEGVTLWVSIVRSPVYRNVRDADAHREDMIAKGARREDYQVIDAAYLTRHAFGL
tara:strand:+ start:2620 stop:2853 length:234 start_codon:yes stop_codon:yes gene_type:complete